MAQIRILRFKWWKVKTKPRLSSDFHPCSMELTVEYRDFKKRPGIWDTSLILHLGDRILGQSHLHCEFRGSKGCRVRPSQKEKRGSKSLVFSSALRQSRATSSAVTSLAWAWTPAPAAVRSDCCSVPPQMAGPPLAAAATTAVSSVLLSPSVFQQTVPRATDLERKASSPSPLTVGTPESQRKPSIILSKSQLQDTLIHLIKVWWVSAYFLILYLSKSTNSDGCLGESSLFQGAPGGVLTVNSKTVTAVGCVWGVSCTRHVCCQRVSQF